MVGSLGSTSTQWDSIYTPSETVRGESNGKWRAREAALSMHQSVVNFVTITEVVSACESASQVDMPAATGLELSCVACVGPTAQRHPLWLDAAVTRSCLMSRQDDMDGELHSTLFLSSIVLLNAAEVIFILGESLSSKSSCIHVAEL
jgi:hypothetical protein